jgi:hypothetical protein
MPSRLYIRFKPGASTVAEDTLNIAGDYSSGYCSGFTPDSLLSGRCESFFGNHNLYKDKKILQFNTGKMPVVLILL